MLDDLINRQAAIDALRTCYDTETVTMDNGDEYINYGDAIGEIEQLPSAQPKRLTDDDFETIRIHLNAFKEKLCNQQRWEEANEYQRIIDRFMAFASVQPVAKDINVPIKDYISRKAAIEALFELYEYQRDIDPTEAADLVRQGVYLAEKKIEQLPPTLPKIVKCKNCIKQPLCKFSQYQGNDGYCSLAERRTDDCV